MDVFKLIKELRADNVAPVYFFHGAETYLIGRVVDRLRTLLVTGPMADFNYSRKTVRDITGAGISAEARSLPMMSDQKLMIVEDADKLKTADHQPLVEYLDRPSPETCLVFIGKKFDLRKALFKKANKAKMVHLSDTLKERELAGFVRFCAEQRRISITEDAVSAIQTAVGADCAALDDALERLALYTGGETVNEGDVEQVVTPVRQHSVFELVDALGAKNSQRAVHLLGELLDEREEPIRINSMLARHFRQLLLVRIMMFQKMVAGDMTRRLGVPSFVVNKLMAQSRGFSGVQLETSLRKLAGVDFQLKSSRLPGGLVLERAMMALCL